MAEPEKPKSAPPLNTSPDLTVSDDGTMGQAAESAVTPAAVDPIIDKAIEDIMKTDSDTVLKSQDQAAAKAVIMKLSWWEKLKAAGHRWWASRRRRYGTLVILLGLVVLLAIPFTRYALLGLVLKEPVSVTVLDSKTSTPVSGATVQVAGHKVQTDANGTAQLRVHVGSKTIAVSKQYYTSYSHKQLLTLSSQHNAFRVRLTALGRQVQIKVVDKVSGKPVAGATVHSGSTQAKTAADGTATVVVPGDATTQPATINLAGYNSLSTSLTPSVGVAKNTFALIPAGKLYFLSNLSGQIDVVKTNLDGTDRQTVLAGTGSEDPNSTSLLASRDWKYLALLSRRSGNTASVYLIDTTNGDKLTTIDEGNASFSLVGWSGDQFIYQVTRNTVSDWQPNQQALKSFNATTGQALLLDQTQASGSGENDYLKQTFGSPYILGNQIVYDKAWNASFNDYAQLNSKQAELDSIGADGSGHKVLKTFSLDPGTQASYVGITTTLYEPDGLYILFNSGGQDSFYDYDAGQVSADSNLTDDAFYQTPYPTYLSSPSGNSTFWSEQRDGKNALFVGDSDAKTPKQIASLSDYSPYGWYSDNYLLVSKNSSELYIMPVAGGTPLKITDYYKPAINYRGYGGGYGGL